MSKKFSLPSLKPASVADAAAEPVVVGATAGVVGAEVVTDATPPAEPADNLVEASVEELGDVVAGLSGAITTASAEAPKASVAAATPSVAVAAVPASVAPVSMAPTDIAKLEELARDQVETRALVAALTKLLETKHEELRGMLQHFNRIAGDADTEMRRRLDAAEAMIKGIASAQLAVENSLYPAFQRLDHIDTMLTSHDLPTSTAATSKPRLRLRPTRALTVPARVVADGVVLAYNPRPTDDIELTVTQSGKPVFSGYIVEVPEGYVADVFVGADAVSSLRGRGDGELLVKVAVRQGFRSIPGGSELCRLALRKVEAVELEIV